MTRINPVSVIAKKRDGQRLSSEEIIAFVSDFVHGHVADYQMSAWLMAALLQGLNGRETFALTQAMLSSGKTLKLSTVRAPKIDKHSTGGVGDKISICLAPLVAACGVSVPMISGRGLGHTGGTLDKLDAIPGYETRLSERAFEQVVRRVGCSIIGQSERLVPADRRMYALRDVTATVESIPLIVASVLSKKLAEGADGVVFDVKVGRGAFMKDLRSARALARALVHVGRSAGRRVSAVLTDMSAPIGITIGNALETKEAIDILYGAGPEDTADLTVELGAEMLLLAQAVTGREEGRRRIQQAIDDGSGLERFRKMLRAHGGDPAVIDDPSKLPKTRERFPVVCRQKGYVTDIDPLALGQLAVAMGAGRTRIDQRIDPAVGIELAVQRGERVAPGQPLAYLHVRSKSRAEQWTPRALAAFHIGPRRPKAIKRILGRLT